MKALFILLSLGLNAAFVATWVVHSLPTETNPKSQEKCCLLREKIGASDTQWREMKARQAKFLTASRGVCQEIKRLQAELIDLIAAPLPDRKAIQAKQEKIVAAQRKMQDLVVSHLLDEKALLTPQQQQALFDLIRTRCGCSGQELMIGGGDGSGSARDCP